MLLLVALALPGVRAVRVGRHRPHTPVVLAVVVDADVPPLTGVGRGDTLPAVGVVAEELSGPATLPVLELAGDRQVTPVERAGVAGGVRGGCRKQASQHNRTCREDGCELSLETHYESFLLEAPESLSGHSRL